jgi:hypothetical protein
MPCDEIIIVKSPSAKTRLKKPRFLRENETLPGGAFSDSQKTSDNTPIDIAEKIDLPRKKPGKRPLYVRGWMALASRFGFLDTRGNSPSSRHRVK